jgi:uncharacterized membrane protein YbhN (UPF0104 family)
VSKKRLILAIKILIFLVVCGWVVWKLYESWDKIREIPWQPNLLFLALAGVCYIIAYLPAAVFWRYAMQSLGQQPKFYETLRAYYIGHLGKYVPGKAMVLIIRTGLLNHKRTKITAAGASVFLETMTMMAVGASVAAITVMLIILFGLHQVEDGNWLILLAVGAMVGIVLPILPPVFHFLTKALNRFNIKIEGLTYKTIAVGWLLNFPVWIMLGVSLWLVMQGLGMKSESIIIELPICILAISFSVVLGFASMMPAGAAVREWAMALVLTPFFATHPIGEIAPEVVAIAIVIAHRVMSIISELTISAILAVPMDKEPNQP